VVESHLSRSGSHCARPSIGRESLPFESRNTSIAGLVVITAFKGLRESRSRRLCAGLAISAPDAGITLGREGLF
jgi:hypothetical protein